MSFDEHSTRIEDPDSYRPDECRWCGHHVLHVHDYRERRLRMADGGVARVRLVRFVCHDCGAIWRILPKFICSGLRATWETVDRVVSGAHDAREVHIPTRTAQRWRARFASAATALVVVLGSTCAHWHHEIVVATGLDGTHADLVDAFGRQTGAMGAGAFAGLAEVLSRIRPGTRLMSETGFTERPPCLQPTPPKTAPCEFSGKAARMAEPAYPIPDSRPRPTAGTGILSHRLGRGEWGSSPLSASSTAPALVSPVGGSLSGAVPT